MMKPFLITVLLDATIEIHSLSNFVILQKLSIACVNPMYLNITICQEDTTTNTSSNNGNGNGLPVGYPGEHHTGSSLLGTSFAFHAYICNGEQLSVIKMIPLTTQVSYLDT